MNYTWPTIEIREKIDALIHTCRGVPPLKKQEGQKQRKPDRERFSVPHASRDPEILVDRNLGNKYIFDLMRNPPEMGVVRILKNQSLGTRPKA